MGIFCKVFEKDGDQVLVVNGKNKDKNDAPAILVSFDLDDELNSTVAINFPDTDAGYEARDMAFSKIDEDGAWGTAKMIRAQIDGLR